MNQEYENGQIKRLIRFFITQYNLSYPTFVLNFIIISQVVAEKSMTENVHVYYVQE